MLNKPGLIKWANKMGLQGVNVGTFKDSARERGSSRHKIIEDFASGVLCEDETMNQKMISFFADKEIIDTEVSFETDYFTGRYDVKLRWQDYVFICDYKSSHRVYFETRLQLAAYKLACPCDKLAVIHFPDLVFNPVEININLYERFLIGLSELYQTRELINDSER